MKMTLKDRTTHNFWFQTMFRACTTCDNISFNFQRQRKRSTKNYWNVCSLVKPARDWETPNKQNNEHVTETAKFEIFVSLSTCICFKTIFKILCHFSKVFPTELKQAYKRNKQGKNKSKDKTCTATFLLNCRHAHIVTDCQTLSPLLQASSCMLQSLSRVLSSLPSGPHNLWGPHQFSFSALWFEHLD